MSLVVPGIERQWHCSCLLTTSTSTGWQQLANKWPQHQRSWLPLDFPWAVESFLNKTKPKALLLLELELWPRLLAACHRRGIPVYLLNGRVSERSYRSYRRFRPLLGPLLRPLRLAIAQNSTWEVDYAVLAAGMCESVAASRLIWFVWQRTNKALLYAANSNLTNAPF